MRIVRTLALTGSLLTTAAAMSSVALAKAPAKKAGSAMVTCPIMHKKVAKSQAIKVTAANGKSTYVCCKSCVEDAKKQLMAKK
jgi:hypothetical protein